MFCLNYFVVCYECEINRLWGLCSSQEIEYTPWSLTGTINIPLYTSLDNREYTVRVNKDSRPNIIITSLQL